MTTARSAASSAPAGYRFPREVIAVAVRWYLRYGLSYRDVEELLAERGIVVDHTTVYRWVQVFTCEFIDAARPARHAPCHNVDPRHKHGRRSSATDGSSMRPTSRWPAGGSTCTARSTSTVR